MLPDDIGDGPGRACGGRVALQSVIAVMNIKAADRPVGAVTHVDAAKDAVVRIAQKGDLAHRIASTRDNRATEDAARCVRGQDRITLVTVAAECAARGD